MSHAIEPAKVGTKNKHPLSGPFSGCDDELDLREIANKRFKLNHELMAEVFDPTMVMSGWGAEIKVAEAATVAKNDYSKVLDDNPGGSYIGAGSIANIPTVSQINKLKSRTEALEKLIQHEQKNMAAMEKAHAEKMKIHEKRSEQLDKMWEDIQNEKPEETYRKWKAKEEASIAAYKAQREADEKKLAEKKMKISGKSSTGNSISHLASPKRTSVMSPKNSAPEMARPLEMQVTGEIQKPSLTPAPQMAPQMMPPKPMTPDDAQPGPSSMPGPSAIPNMKPEFKEEMEIPVPSTEEGVSNNTENESVDVTGSFE